MDGNNFNNGYDPNAGYQAPAGDPNAAYGAPAGDPNAAYGAPAGDPNMAYGAPAGDPNMMYGAPQQPEKKTKEVLALVFGICAIVFSCCCTYLSIALGIAGVILAIMSKNEKGRFTGMAMAGMICSIIGAAISIICIILVLVGVIDTSWVNDLMEQYQ